MLFDQGLRKGNGKASETETSELQKGNKVEGSRTRVSVSEILKAKVKELGAAAVVTY